MRDDSRTTNSQRFPSMSRFLFPLFSASLLAAACARAEVPSAPASSVADEAAEVEPFKAGESAPAALLAAPALLGEPAKSFEPGVAHVITLWNTVGGHPFAPGYNLTRALSGLPAGAPVRPLVVMSGDEIAPEKLAKRLALPSQKTPYAMIRVSRGSEAERAYARLKGSPGSERVNTLIVRDGRIVWVGEGHNLESDALVAFTKPGFEYERYVVEKAAYDARTKELLTLFVKELPAASKAGNAARAEEILATLENEPNLHPFLYQRLRDTRCFQAVDKGDIPGALAEMRKLAEKYPDSASTQAWVHKIIMSTEPLSKPGAELAAIAASRVARAKSGEMSVAWWQAAAKHRRDIGDKAGALAALEEAQRRSGPYRRLVAMRAGGAAEE